jgi:hypothetical protein
MRCYASKQDVNNFEILQDAENVFIIFNETCLIAIVALVRMQLVLCFPGKTELRHALKTYFPHSQKIAAPKQENRVQEIG